MIVLADTSEPLEKLEAELEIEVHQLLTPLSRFKNRGRKYGIDNGSYAGFDEPGFCSLLKREEPNRDRCLFVVAPDVVGNARRTLEVFDHWAPRLEGWPLALAIQDGQEDLPIPWDRIAAVFIGGSTQFKLSMQAEAVILAAKAIGKWTHVGRVNTPSRVRRFVELGVDSIDGTGLSRYSWMRRDVANIRLQPALLRVSEAAVA